MKGKEMMKRTVVAAFLVATLCAGANETPTDTTKQSFNAWLVQLDKDFRGDATKKKAAVKRMLPTQDDFEKLFPGNGKALWKARGPHFSQLLKNSEKVADEIVATKMKTVYVVDLRKKDIQSNFQTAVDVAPEGVPLFGVAKEDDDANGGYHYSSIYIKVNGRWRWFWGMSEVPEILRLSNKPKDKQDKRQPMVIPDLELTLVPIEPGTFMMGANNGFSNQRPRHKVTLPAPFWMGRTEVTNAQYKEVMGGTVDYKADESDIPVTQVTWTEATAFCKKLTTREHRSARLPKNHEYRLPTEDQWEYCCRAGSTTDFSFGSNNADLIMYAWFSLNAKNPKPVGKKQPNVWGLYDMYGNVAEWCLDSKAIYRGKEWKRPEGFDQHAFRGGSYMNHDFSCRSAHRDSWKSNFRSANLGFRIVCIPVTKTGSEPEK